VLRTALERIYTEPLRFSPMQNINPDEPLKTWLYNALIDFLNGAEAQKVMLVAQTKSDTYMACILPQIGLSGNELGAAVIDCARQSDPGRCSD